MEERRKYIRIPENLEISYKVIPEDEGLRTFTTRDISQGGIRFLVRNFIPKGSRLKIRFALGKSSLVIEAVVHLVWIKESVHSNSYEVGVEFVDVPSKASELLSSCIREFLKAEI